MKNQIKSCGLCIGLIGALVLLLTRGAMAQPTSIVNSAHNLSASGPGAVRAAAEQQVCIFCHTPHNATPVQPLWNRTLPTSAYTVYSSNSLNASPGQPTGSSKLCLSCHDGTIALGSVASRNQPITMAGGITTLPPGAGNLGTDLADDHPISFKYDAALATKNPKLKLPSQLPEQIKLDSQSELQCTSCHEPHNNQFGKFLVMDNTNSQLCSNCHTMGQTTLTGHLQCASCHQEHSAPSGPYLLKAATVTDTCTTCHGGQPGPMQGINVAAELNKASRHDTRSPVNQKDHIPNNVVCNDCHEPHTMTAEAASAPMISGKLGQINGITADGAAIAKAQFEYEVCFKCHAEQTAQISQTIGRQIVQTNTRLEFAKNAISYHPVEAPGKNTTSVPSLVPGLTTGSVIACSDCHNSDASRRISGGTGADGPHGSGFTPLLSARYVTADNTSETTDTYALCYRCHNRNSILGNESFSLHKLHIADKTTPCSVCHDAHGISQAQGTDANNKHLINFDTSVVRPNAPTTPIEYKSTGVFMGNCTLTCHDFTHTQSAYAPGVVGENQMLTLPQRLKLKRPK